MLATWSRRALCLVLVMTALAKLLSAPAASVRLPPWVQYVLGLTELWLAGALFSRHAATACGCIAALSIAGALRALVQKVPNCGCLGSVAQLTLHQHLALAGLALMLALLVWALDRRTLRAGAAGDTCERVPVEQVD